MPYALIKLTEIKYCFHLKALKVEILSVCTKDYLIFHP